MAVVTLKTTTVTNLDLGKPAAATDQGGRVRSISSVIETGSADDIGSTYRMARVPSNARVLHIWLMCDAVTSGAADVGLYRTAADGGAVVAAHAYGSAISIATAINKSPIDAAFEDRDIDAILNRVWQDAGLSADSKTEYDIALTLTAATTAAGGIALTVEYVID